MRIAECDSLAPLLLSIVVLAWNSERTIEACIEAVLEQAAGDGIAVELLVVDNGSVDLTSRILALLAKEHENVRIVSLCKNMGTTKSRNMALRRCRGTFIMVLDSDAFVRSGVLAQLVADLQSDSSLGIVGPRLQLPSGDTQASCKRFPTLHGKALNFLPWDWSRQLGTRDERYPSSVYDVTSTAVVRVDHVISAAWMMRRRLLDGVGFFDERIFYAPEDVDYCLRTWLAGWTVGYDNRVTVLHETQQLGHSSALFALRLMGGLLYYFTKYHYAFSRKGVYRRVAAAVQHRLPA